MDARGLIILLWAGHAVARDHVTCEDAAWPPYGTTGRQPDQSVTFFPTFHDDLNERDFVFVNIDTGATVPFELKKLDTPVAVVLEPTIDLAEGRYRAQRLSRASGCFDNDWDAGGFTEFEVGGSPRMLLAERREDRRRLQFSEPMDIDGVIEHLEVELDGAWEPAVGASGNNATVHAIGSWSFRPFRADWPVPWDLDLFPVAEVTGIRLRAGAPSERGPVTEAEFRRRDPTWRADVWRTSSSEAWCR